MTDKFLIMLTMVIQMMKDLLLETLKEETILVSVVELFYQIKLLLTEHLTIHSLILKLHLLLRHIVVVVLIHHYMVTYSILQDLLVQVNYHMLTLLREHLFIIDHLMVYNTHFGLLQILKMHRLLTGFMVVLQFSMTSLICLLYTSPSPRD